MARRFAILLLAVATVVAIPAAVPVYAQQNAPDAPADGPSGTGNNPAAGQSGGGAETPTSKGSEGNGLLPVALFAVVVLVIGGGLAIARRHRQVETGRTPGHPG
jgi:hypothetical protein